MRKKKVFKLTEEDLYLLLRKHTNIPDNITILDFKRSELTDCLLIKAESPDFIPVNEGALLPTEFIVVNDD